METFALFLSFPLRVPVSYEQTPSLNQLSTPESLIMSWYRDPQLFLVRDVDDEVHVVRIKKEFGSHIAGKADLITDCESLSFSKHLSFGNNKESDLEIFIYYLSTRCAEFVNCQGLVVTCTEPLYPETYTWSRVEPDSLFHSLPGISRNASATEALSVRIAERNKYLWKNISELLSRNRLLKDEVERNKLEKQALEERVSELESDVCALKDEAGRNKIEKQYLERRDIVLETKISALAADTASLYLFLSGDNKAKDLTDITIVPDEQEQLNGEKDEKQPIVTPAEDNSPLSSQTRLSKKKKKKKDKKQVTDQLVTSKVEEWSSGSGSSEKEPWMNSCTVSSKWVPFEELHQKISITNSKILSITKTSGAPAFGDDNTTNVRTGYFYRAMLNKRVYPVVVVDVAELIPNNEKATFDPNIWGVFINAGCCYAGRKAFESEMPVDAPKTC